MAGEWSGKHTTTVKAFTRDGISALMAEAKTMKEFVRGSLDSEAKARILDCCKGKILACVFYEASTRTNCSFTAAMYRLGGNVVQVNSTASSVKKGETLSDTLKCLECYSDILVLRHPMKGSAEEGSKALTKPLLNAGDGAGEHPTQALLDLYTILDEQDRIDGLEITLLGDLKYGRTTHSLAQLLCHYKVKINLVSPEGLEMPSEVTDTLSANGVPFNVTADLSSVLGTTDVLYVTRIQKERFSDEAHYEKVKDQFIVDANLLKGAKTTTSIMHPLPRVNEISTDVDTDPRAAYFRQMENGMFVRMALIALTLNVL